MSDIPLGTTVVTGHSHASTDDNSIHLRNRAHWGAIFAGLATALVVQLLLNILGIGIGMSSVDMANLADNPSGQTASLTTAAWITLSGILASLVGGIVAGRLCGSADRGTGRWHGFVSWCAATLVIVYLLTTAVGSLIGGTFGALGSTLGAAGKGAAGAVSGVAQGASNNGDALQAQVRRLVNPNDAQSAQDNVAAYMRASLSGDKPAADAARDRAVDSIARTANISPDEARTRLQQAEDQARQAANTAKQKAQEAAEATRKGVASAGIFGFVALALGGIAAIIGGGLGTSQAVVPRRI